MTARSARRSATRSGAASRPRASNKAHRRCVRSSLAVLSLAALAAVPASAASGLWFPPAGGEWERVAPRAAGWDESALDAALDYAGEQGSSDVVVLLDGRLLAERSFPPPEGERYGRMLRGATADGRPIEDVASVQKSVAAFLVAMARERGLLDPDRPVSAYLGEGWSKAPGEREAAITVRQLMTMTSGLDDALRYREPAGEAWRYNTGAYSRVTTILESVTGREIDPLTREWLAGPLGMDDTAWMPRPWAQGMDAANAVGLATTARDAARFGLLVLAGGRWAGEPVLGDAELLAELLRPSQQLNPSYGLLWWLNGQPWVRSGNGEERRPGPLVATAPDDLVAALGALGRKVWVVPSLSLVVVRLGDQPADRDFDERFWQLLLAAAPSGPGGTTP